jgi:hypothetical protein
VTLHDRRESVYSAVDAAAESLPPRPADEPIVWPCDSAEAVRAMVAALDWDDARPEVQRKAAAGYEHWVAGGMIRGVTLVLCSPMVRCRGEETCGACVDASAKGELLCDACGAVR